MAQSTVQPLPADVFHLLTEVLATNNEFGTLYSCIVSSKLIANAGGVNALYRISHESVVKEGGIESSFADQQVMTMKWALMWRTILLSALHKTMYPYCRHLRMLDLRNLSSLMEHFFESKTKDKIQKAFFAGDLAQFRIVYGKDRGPRYAGRIDVKETVLAIGDEITQQSPLIEGLSEPSGSSILTSVLPTWTARLSHLRELELWDGKMLENEDLRRLINTNCPKLDKLGIYLSTDPDSDENLAAFITGMAENTLVKFQNISSSKIGAQTFLALNNHAKSLKQLTLHLDHDGVTALGFLRGCTSLNKLEIGSSGHDINLKETENDVFLEMIEWLKSCDLLHTVSISNIASAPDLLLPVLLNSNVQLETLHINARDNAMYTVKDHHDFHQALATQRTVRDLYISADPDPLESRDDIDTLMTTFCSLTNLRKLGLSRISDYFSDEHLITLARSLPHLTDLSIGGYGITDGVLSSIASLKNLESLAFSGITTFTTAGLLTFIDSLDESIKKLAISVEMADPDTMISTEDQDLIRTTLASKVIEGTFEYQPLRDPNVPEFDQSDSE